MTLKEMVEILKHLILEVPLDQHNLSEFKLKAEVYIPKIIEEINNQEQTQKEYEALKQNVTRYFEILDDKERWRDIKLLNEANRIKRGLKKL
jgi:hypothetical protein